MAGLTSWMRKRRLLRRSDIFFPRDALLDPEIASGRFREALSLGREAYARMRDNGTHIDFVHSDWERNTRDLESCFMGGINMDFLDNPVINASMVFTNRDVHAAESAFLHRWRDPEALRTYIGGGLNAQFLTGRQKPATAMNSVHHLYHLARFEAFMSERIEDVGDVVEFGGGYGNMARIFRNFGKSPRYTILDLPLFCCIQYVYLCTVEGPGKVNLIDGTGKGLENGKINLVPIALLDAADIAGDLFLSTWALSESTGQAYRYVTRRGWFGAGKILLANHKDWKPWDDDGLKEDLENLGHRVVVEPIPFLPGNQYVFSRKTTP